MAPPSHHAVLQGMKKLEETLKDLYEKNEAVRKEGDEVLAKLRAPLAKIVGNDDDLIKKRINQVKNAGRPAKPTPVKIVPKTHPAGIFDLLHVPPYNYEWTAKGGDANTSASANNQNGSIGIGVGAANEHGYASGGVGVLFSPPRNMLVYFKPLVTYNFNWLDLADFINARSSAFFGIYIQQFDSTGHNVNNTDLRYQLWNDDAGWLDEHHNSGTGATINQSPTISVYGGSNYIFWAWFSVSCSNGFNTFSDGAIEAVVHSMLFLSTD
jgi:hypothetical protein